MLINLNDLLFLNINICNKQQYLKVQRDMNFVGTRSNFLRSLSKLTGFDRVTNQVHIPVKFNLLFDFEQF